MTPENINNIKHILATNGIAVLFFDVDFGTFEAIADIQDRNAAITAHCQSVRAPAEAFINTHSGGTVTTTGDNVLVTAGNEAFYRDLIAQQAALGIAEIEANKPLAIEIIESS